MRDFRNLSTKELLDILPAEIEHKDFDGYYFEPYTGVSENYTMCWSKRKMTFYLNLRKRIKDGKVIWKISYDKFAIGEGGVDSSLPKKIVKSIVVEDGIEDENIHTILKKMCIWLQREGLIE